MSDTSQQRLSTPGQVRQCCCNKAGIGWESAGVTTFCRKAFTQRFIATIQTSNTWNPRSRCCNGRCPRDVFIRIPFWKYEVQQCVFFHKGYYIHIRRGLRSCLSKRGGKFEGLDCEISSEYGSHAFFISCSYNPRNHNFLYEVARAFGANA